MDPLKDLKELLQNTEDGTSLEELFSEMGMDLKELEKQMVQKIDIEYTNSSDKILNYAYESDSGFDLYSNEEIILPSLGRALVPTGIRFNIPENYEIQVRSKSGLAINRGLMVLNSPGTVDCFSEDMKILTVSGEKTIKELNINDIVFSFNEKTLEIEKDVIVHIFNTEEQEIIVFETDEGILEVTPNSEIYTKNGLKLAKELKENDEIIIF
jgi:dUTPase